MSLISEEKITACSPLKNNTVQVLLKRENDGSLLEFQSFNSKFLSKRLQMTSSIIGHLSSIYCLTFDKTGKYFITGADDALIKLWNSSNGRLIFTFRGASEEIIDFSINLENTLLAVVSHDKYIRIWSLTNGSLLESLLLCSKPTSVSFSPLHRTRLAFRFLSFSLTNGSCAFWAYTDEEETGPLFFSQPTIFQEKIRPGSAFISSASFSAGGVFFATGSIDKNVRIYYMLNYEGPERVLESECHLERVDHVVWSHNDLRFLSASRDGTALVWRYESRNWRYITIKVCTTPEEIEDWSKKSEKPKISVVAWNNDDKLVLTALSINKNIKVWDSHEGTLLKTLRGHTNEIFVIESHPFFPNIICSSSHDSRIIIWDVARSDKNDENYAKILKKFVNFYEEEQKHAAILDTKWSPDGLHLIATDSLGHIIFLQPVAKVHSNLNDLPKSMFFHTDYRGFYVDEITKKIMDETSKMEYHLMPPPYLVDVDGIPYPPNIQKLVPGRENNTNDQLIPNIAQTPEGRTQVLDDDFYRPVNLIEDNREKFEKTIIPPLSEYDLKFLDKKCEIKSKFEEDWYIKQSNAFEKYKSGKRKFEFEPLKENEHIAIPNPRQKEIIQVQDRVGHHKIAWTNENLPEINGINENVDSHNETSDSVQNDNSSDSDYAENKYQDILRSTNSPRKRKSTRRNSFSDQSDTDTDEMRRSIKRIRKYSDNKISPRKRGNVISSDESEDDIDDEELDRVLSKSRLNLRPRDTKGLLLENQNHYSDNEGGFDDNDADGDSDYKMESEEAENASDLESLKMPSNIEKTQFKYRYPIGNLNLNTNRSYNRCRKMVISSEDSWNTDGEESGSIFSSREDDFVNESDVEENEKQSINNKLEGEGGERIRTRKSGRVGSNSIEKNEWKSRTRQAKTKRRKIWHLIYDSDDSFGNDPVRVEETSHDLNNIPIKAVPITSEEKAWIREIRPKRNFFPQIGDELVYFRQGHDEFLKSVRKRNAYELEDSMNQKLFWYFIPLLSDGVPVKITNIVYETKFSIRMANIELTQTDWESGEYLGVPFNVYYHDLKGAIDFLVPRNIYDRSMFNDWQIGDRFRCLISTKWWIGKIKNREPNRSEFPDSEYQAYQVEWDYGEVEKLSIWELEKIPQNFEVPLIAQLGIKANKTDLLAYELSPEWKEDSQRICNILNDILSIEGFQKLQDFLATENKDEESHFIHYPIDLKIIKSRLQFGFYRRLESLIFDANYIRINSERFGEPEVSHFGKLFEDLVLRIADPEVKDLKEILFLTFYEGQGEVAAGEEDNVHFAIENEKMYEEKLAAVGEIGENLILGENILIGTETEASEAIIQPENFLIHTAAEENGEIQLPDNEINNFITNFLTDI